MALARLDQCAIRSRGSNKNGRVPRLPSLRSRSSPVNENVSPRYTSFFQSPRTEDGGFVPRSAPEDCLKCMLRVPHSKCVGHKYIRIGGGYRHSYWYVKAMLEELELRRQQELVRQQRLEAIQERNVRAIKTYIRTNSGKLVERVVFMSEDDYQKFREGGREAEDIIKQYLSKEEAKRLQKWDKDEQHAITTYIRTKSGRRVKRLVYVSSEDYEAIKKGKKTAASVLKKYVKVKPGEKLDGWDDAKMRQIKTYVRTKSGRLVEKTVMVSQEDYDKLQELEKQGKDPSELLKKYMATDEGDVIEGWKKPEPTAMKSVKVKVRTKSGKLVEKTILMTEEEFNEFQESGGDPKALKKFMNLGRDDVIEDWEKASTVYSASDDEDVAKAMPGSRIVGKDGVTYEIVEDPITGKKYKKKISTNESDADSGIGSMPHKKRGAKGIFGAGIDEEDPAETNMTKEEKEAYRKGKRRDDSDSEYSYRSVVSAGGTRHVRRKKKNEDGTYGDSDSYHSSQDEEGEKRRQQRRGTRKKKAVEQKKKRFAQGHRDKGSDSEFSYRSERSAGGTRHVKRRRKKADGTYSDSESYHSSQDEGGKQRRKNRRAKRINDAKKGKRIAGSDSEYSYKSDVSAGGTRRVRRRRKHADGTYSADESYHSSQDEAGQKRRKDRRKKRQEAFKKGKRNEDSDSEYSYRSVVSAGGTRHVRRRRRKGDGEYSASDSYHSSQDEGGQMRRRRRRRERKHGPGSAHSYFSVTSEGGTRHVRRRRKRKDGTYSSSESYHSDDSDFFSDAEGKKRKKKKKRREHGSDSEYSYFSEVSEGGTKTRKRKQRIRDAKGKVIGHGKAEDYSSSEASSYEYKPDGKGGKIRIKKPKGKKKPVWKRGVDGYVSDPLDGDSLASTDSEAERKIMASMTEEEKEKYMADKKKRKAEREKKRKEKFGDKYDEIMEKHGKAKKAKDQWKSMVSYEQGQGRFKDGEFDERSVGLGHEDWQKGKRKGKKKNIDGNEADDESEDGDTESVYEYVRDEHGNILKDEHGKPIKKKVGVIKKNKKGVHGADSDDEFEYTKDEHGNMMRKKKTKKKEKRDGEESSDSDGDYFETNPDGTVKLKKGKNKIDIAKLTDDDLRKLGIDPTLSKQEIARKLKEKFGDEIRIEKGRGQKVGLKHVSAYGSDADTDALADDSDLDTSTLTGQRRIRVLMKKGGPAIQDHMKKVIDGAKITDDPVQHPEERDASIDFLSHYRLIDPGKVDSYARAFVVEDEDKDYLITSKDTRLALDGVPSIQAINKKQLNYVLKVLDIDKETNVTFRMFAVITALAERVTSMDPHCKHLLEISNLADIERKMELYKAMFYCNVESDRDPNYIVADSLRIELMAGGLNWKQQEFIMERMKPNAYREISFLDYLTYIPLFLSMHDKICDNPLDMSSTKYEPPRPVSPQRDKNPLGYPLKQDSVYLMRRQRAKAMQQKADDLLAGKREKEIRNESLELFNKYQKLPHITSGRPPSGGWKRS